MISRFRPSYKYSDIFYSLFLEYEKSKKSLEKEIQELYKTKHVFFFNQARTAIYAFLKSLEIRGGVLSPAYNCIVVPDAIRFAGLENQFVDISLEDYNIDYRSLYKATNSKSKVLVMTHQFGIPCDIEKLKYLANKKKLIVFEDAACAMGAKYEGRIVGTFGEASVLSFQDTKVINGVEGGCLLVYKKEFADRVEKYVTKSLPKTNFGLFMKSLVYKLATLPAFYSLVFKIWTKKAGAYTQAEKSEKLRPKKYLSEMSPFSINLIMRQIKDLDSNLIRRNHVANFYLRHLSNEGDLILPRIQKGVMPAWTRFPIRVKNKKSFFEKVASRGVDLAWTFSYSCAEEYNSKKSAPNSALASETVLDLPIYPDLSKSEVKKIARVVKESI